MAGGKEAYAAANTVPAKRPPGRPPKPAPTPPATDPAAVVEDSKSGNDTDPDASAAAMKAAHSAADVSDDDAILGAESKPPVTDDMLRKAMTLKNGKLQPVHKQEGALMIRKLIAKYAGAPPKASHDIPQEVRQKFLDELEALS